MRTSSICRRLVSGARIALGVPDAGRRGLHVRVPRRRHDSLFTTCSYDGQIRHILVRHEENAAFAAEGYARATGKVGVCCATSGPGATNLTTGLVDALMDSIPIVAITGQVGHQSNRQATHSRKPTRFGHHALRHQAQLPDHESRRPAAHCARSVLRGRDRPAGSGSGGYREGTCSRGRATTSR